MSFRTCFIVALVGIAWSCVLGLQRPPPRYSQQYMPETAFSCRNKIVGSYYADPETDCQLFHVCVSEAGSVQDYKFLCPNDTAFDQESQTCADWYDVDCEAATLYYASDNFDLYRLGSGLESLHYDSVRSDAEPQDNLQRSETSDPVRSAANSLNRVTPSNSNSNSNSNANSNSRDILRGSSSINFYNSRNGGKDEDYDSEKPYEPVQQPKKISGVRKVARKQQHNTNNNVNNVNLGNNYAASSTIAPVVASSPSTNNYNGNYYNNNNNYNRQRTSSFPSSTTLSPVSQDNYNVRNQNNQKYNTPTSTYRPSTAQQTYSTYQAPSTTARTTAFNNYNTNNNAYNTNNNQQQTSNSYGQNIGTSPRPTSYSQNYPSVSVTTAKSTSYSENYPDQQNFKNQYTQFVQNARTQSTTVQPSSNFDYTKSSDFTNFQRNYNNIQRSTSAANTLPSTTAASTFFDNYNTNSGQYNKASGQPSTRQATQTTKFYPPNYAGSSYIPTTYSPATKKAVINENTPIQSNGRGIDRYNTQATGNDNGQYVNEQNPQQAKSAQYYESTRAPKKVTQYNSNSADRFGSQATGNDNNQYNNQQSAKSTQFYDSTRAPKKQNEHLANNNAPAQSNGRGIDRYNSQATGNDNGQYVNEQNPQQAKSTQYYEATRAPKKTTQYNSNYDITNNGKYYESSTGSYDNGRSQGAIGFSPSSINLLAETPRSTTPAPKRTGGPTTYNPNNYNANNQRQTPTTPRGTTLVSGSARPFSTTARFTDATTPRPKTAKKNDYDYAYYDNAGGLEYDGLDLEHVVAGNKESSKISRN